MSEESTTDLIRQYVMPNYARFPLCFTRGEGVWLWDEAGKRYLDFGAGIAVCTLGHAPAFLSDAIAAQAKKLIHSSNLYQIREQAELARFLVEKVVKLPGKVFLCNSGAEANDSLIKLARMFGHVTAEAHGHARYEVITCVNSFHGRTLGGIAATGQEKVKKGFEPLLEGFRHVPYNDIEALRAAVTDKTAAILLEVIQGEGGIHVATPEYLQAVSDLCREKHLLFMLDEVQCGLGRTGESCAWRAVLKDSGVKIEPDAVSWAKGLAGGFPMGGIWAKAAPIMEGVNDGLICDLLGPGTHGSTFGGTPLGSVAALAVLKEIEDKDLIRHAGEMGDYARQRVKDEPLPFVTGMRGLGLMLGFVLDTGAVETLPAFVGCGLTPSAFVVRQLQEAGLLTVPAGPGVVRWLPPLNVTKDEMDEAFAIMKEVLTRLAETVAASA